MCFPHKHTPPYHKHHCIHSGRAAVLAKLSFAPAHWNNKSVQAHRNRGKSAFQKGGCTGIVLWLRGHTTLCTYLMELLKQKTVLKAWPEEKIF